MAGGKGKITGADGKPFKKGDSRINRRGRPLKLPDLDSLLIEILGEKIQGKDALKVILNALRKKAFSGDIRATELLLDRAYGKLKQSSGLDFNIQQLSSEQITELIQRLYKDK
jgi:hypothetical protein